MTMDAWAAYLKGPFEKFAIHLETILPNLVGALILVALGLILAFLLRSWTSALIRMVNRLIKRRSAARGLETTALGHAAPGIVSRIIFWVVFLFFLAAAIETLGQPVISEGFGTIARYLPNVLAAALILFVGIFAGNMIKAAIDKFTRTSQISHGDILGNLAQFLVVFTAILIAIDQIGIHIHLLIIIFSILTGMLGAGLALAFALGARTEVSNIIASHYILKKYQVGHTVKIAGVEGRIVEIDLTTVVVETAEGRHSIPAHRFSTEISSLLKEGR